MAHLSDGRLLWTVARDDRRYDTWVVGPSLEKTALFSARASPVSAVVELPGGRLAVAVGAQVLVLDAQTLAVLHTLRGHRRGGILWSLTPVPGDRLVSRSTDGTVRLWHDGAGRALHCVESSGLLGAEVGADLDDPEAVLLLSQPDPDMPGALALLDLARGGRPRPIQRVVSDDLGAVSCAAALRPGTSEVITAITPLGDAGATTTLTRWVSGRAEIIHQRPTRRPGVASLNELFFPTPGLLMALGAKDAALVDLTRGTLRDDVRAYRVTSSGLALVEETEVLDLNTAARLLLPSGILRTPKVLAASSLAEDGTSFALGAGDELVWWRLHR